MTAEQIAAASAVLRRAGIVEFSGHLECETPSGSITDSHITLKLGPLPPPPSATSASEKVGPVRQPPALPFELDGIDRETLAALQATLEA